MVVDSTLKMTSLQADLAQPFCLRLSKILAERCTIKIEFVESNNWQERFRQMETGEVQLGVMCGLHYVFQTARSESFAKLLAAPIMSGDLYREKPHYYSYVVVNSKSAFYQWDDLRGARWGFNEPSSQSGYNLLLHELVVQQEKDDFIGEILQSKSHQNSLSAITRGQIDAAVIDSTVFELARFRDSNWYDRFRVIKTLGPSMAPPIVVSTKLPQHLVDLLRQEILNLHTTEESRVFLEEARISRYVAVQDSDYDDIRKMHSMVEGVFPGAFSKKVQHACEIQPPFFQDFKTLLMKTELSS